MELDKQKKRKATKESEREREREYRADQTDRQTDRDFDGTSMPRRAFENKFTKKKKQRKRTTLAIRIVMKEYLDIHKLTN